MVFTLQKMTTVSLMKNNLDVFSSATRLVHCTAHFSKMVESVHSNRFDVVINFMLVRPMKSS